MELTDPKMLTPKNAILQGFAPLFVNCKPCFLVNTLTDNITYAIYSEARAAGIPYPVIIYGRSNDAFEGSNYEFVQVDQEGSALDGKAEFEAWEAVTKTEKKAAKKARITLKTAKA